MTLPRPIETFAIPEPRIERLYVRTPERLRGPFDVSVLKAMQVRGEIQPDTLLSPDRVRWVTAVTLSDLFPIALYVSTGPKTPHDMLWHVMIEGQRQGPIAWNSLVELAASGKLRAMDLVTVDGGDNWVRASTIAGLTVAPDNGPSVLTQSKSSWLIGGGISVTILMLIPAVLMMVWNEKRLTFVEDTYVRDEGFRQESALAENKNATDVRISEIAGESTIVAAQEEAKGVTEAAKARAAGEVEAAKVQAKGGVDVANIQFASGRFRVGDHVGTNSGFLNLNYWHGLVVSVSGRTYEIKVLESGGYSTYQPGITYTFDDSEIQGLVAE